MFPNTDVVPGKSPLLGGATPVKPGRARISIAATSALVAMTSLRCGGNRRLVRDQRDGSTAASRRADGRHRRGLPAGAVRPRARSRPGSRCLGKSPPAGDRRRQSPLRDRVPPVSRAPRRWPSVEPGRGEHVESEHGDAVEGHRDSNADPGHSRSSGECPNTSTASADDRSAVRPSTAMSADIARAWGRTAAQHNRMQRCQPQCVATYVHANGPNSAARTTLVSHQHDRTDAAVPAGEPDDGYDRDRRQQSSPHLDAVGQPTMPSRARKDAVGDGMGHRHLPALCYEEQAASPHGEPTGRCAEEHDMPTLSALPPARNSSSLRNGGYLHRWLPPRAIRRGQPIRHHRITLRDSASRASVSEPPYGRSFRPDADSFRPERVTAPAPPPRASGREPGTGNG